MPAPETLPRLRTRLALLYAAIVVALGAVLVVVVAAPFWTVRAAHAVGAPPGPATGNAGVLLRAAVPGMALIALVAGPLGWWLAGRAVRPLERIAADARSAAPDRLPARGEPGRYREFADLSSTLSALYARLDAAYSAQRRFVADASHELRTPLAVQRTLIQVALADPDADAAARREVYEELLRLNDQQERLVAALLALAAGEHRTRSDEVDLAALAADALAPVEGLMTRADLRPAVVPGADPTLLASLVGNLVDNAVRYNVPGGRISVTTGRDGDRSVLTVANTGPIVPADAVERIQRPFQRLTAGRTDASDGSGLGLAIVRAIADSHAATLRIRAQPSGGLHVEVSFPGSP